jgi:hypothetical protein
MAPPARRDRAVTWSAGKPRLGRAAAEVCSTFVMRADVMNISLLFRHTAHKGVLRVALCIRRYRMRRARARVGQAWRWPLSPWAITSPRSLFF